MLRIAICDDLQDQLEIMKTAIQTYFKNNLSNIKIHTYDNAMNFVDAFEEKKRLRYHLIGYLHARPAGNRHCP